MIPVQGEGGAPGRWPSMTPINHGPDDRRSSTSRIVSLIRVDKTDTREGRYALMCL